ncbi:uncharacterized protein LOC134040764 [Osmerus eperlanus]|uniref:uncharacterized protein LOC134040764 n=1 Tax=Osmerus eperlanus TaxID=29151 RepID=UPI002E1393D8
MDFCCRAEEYLQANNSFRHNAFKFIEFMIESGCPDIYIDEIIHSILFLGHILYLETGIQEYTPKIVLDDMYDEIKSLFERPMVCYKTELPKRTPFSCVLDMFVHRYGTDNEQQIVTTLGEQVKELKLMDGYSLSSSTICVSQYLKGKKYYGASMSSTGRTAGKIMIAVSCLHTWHKSVSDAVMSYFPGKSRRNDFKGTFELPDSVSCRAYSLRNGEDIPPCKSCRNLFGLTTTDTTNSDNQFVYGNCAEAESVSRLLTGEQDVASVIARQVEASPLYNTTRRKHVVSQVPNQLPNLNNFKGVLGFFVYYNPNE